MVIIINSGQCISCGEMTTNAADGRQRPFCDKCEKNFNAKISKGKIGDKFKSGRLVFPTIEEEEI